MKAVYLKLFRLEIQRRQRSGGFLAAEKFLDFCQSWFKKPEYRAIACLERANTMFWLGRWEECLALLDEAELNENLMEADDKAYFNLLSARLHQGYGDFNQALAFLEIASQESEQGDGLKRIEATLEMGALFHRIGEQERGNDFLQDAHSQLLTSVDDNLSSRLAFEQGLVSVRDEQLAEAQGHFESAMKLIKTRNKPSVTKGEGLRFLGILAALDSRPYDALKLQKEALECFSELPYPLGCAKSYNSLGQTCLQLGRNAEAQFFLQKAESICKDIGAEAERAMTLGKLGLVFSRQGHYEKAISYQKQDLAISSSFGNYRALAFSLRNLGLSYKAKGDLSKAVGHLRDSRDRFAELEDHAFQIKTDLDLVDALLEHDRLMEAFGYLEDAQNLLERRLEVTADHVNAIYFAGLVALNAENHHKSENLLWQALEMCQAFSMQARQAEVHYQLGRLYLAKDEPDTAQVELLSAYRLAKAHSLADVLAQIISVLYEIDPEGLFQEILHPQF